MKHRGFFPMKNTSRILIAAAISFSAISTSSLSLHAAWKVDPHFRPLATFGYSFDTVTAIQADGRIIYDYGRKRVNADGSEDPTFSSPDDTRRFVLVGPNDELVAMPFSSSTVEVIWLTETGAHTSARAMLDGFVQAIRFLPDGHVFILGEFTTVNDTSRPRLARLHPDGSLDTSFDAGTFSGATTLHLYPDGRVLCGGDFDTVSGVPRNQLVRLTSSGGVDLSFDPGPPVILDGMSDPSIPSSITVDDQGRVYRIDGVEVRRYEADGSNEQLLTTVTPSMGSDSRFSLVPHGDGVLISGDFNAVDGVPRQRLARLRADGTLDEEFNVNFIADPGGLWGTTSSGHLYFGTLNGLVRLTPTSALDPTFTMPYAKPGPASIRSLALEGESVYIAGSFTHLNGTPVPGLARVKSDGELDSMFDPGTGVAGLVNTMVRQTDGLLLVGGDFDRVQGQQRVSLARLTSTGALDATFNAHFAPGSIVRSIALQSDGRIVVGGSFTMIDGTSRAHLARLLPDGTLDLSFQHTTGITGEDPIVYDIERLDDDRLLVSGHFDAWNGVPRKSIMRLNVDGSLDATFDATDLATSSSVYDAAVLPDGSTAVAARIIGSNSDVNQVSRLAVDGESIFSVEASYPYPWYDDDEAKVAVVADETGGIIFEGTPTLGGLERYTAGGVRDPKFFPDLFPGPVATMLREPDGSILVAGKFRNIDGLPRPGVFRLQDIAIEIPRMANMSTRGYVGSGDSVMIAGFYVSGTEPHRLLIRSVARHLAKLGITNRAELTGFEIYRVGEPEPFASYDPWWTEGDYILNWTIAERVGAFAIPVSQLPGPGTVFSPDDPSMVVDLPPGGYTVQLSAHTPGIGLVEIYDATGVEADRKLINLSTRGHVRTGDERLIAGFVIDRGPKRVLLRAVGPRLASMVSGVLANPRIELVRQSDHQTIATNDNWGDAPNADEIRQITPSVAGLLLHEGSADAAILTELPPGLYTAIVSGVGNTTGIALVEVYEVPESE